MHGFIRLYFVSLSYGPLPYIRQILILNEASLAPEPYSSTNALHLTPHIKLLQEDCNHAVTR